MNSYLYFIKLLKDEFISFYKFCKDSLIIILFLVIAALTVTYTNLIFDNQIYYAFDERDETWQVNVAKAAKVLKENGISATLVDTSGAVGSVTKIDDNSKVNAAFTYGAVLTESEIQGIYSLGSIDYEPIWIFYKKDLASKILSIEDIAQYRVGVGPKEGGTYRISEKLFKASGINIHNNSNFQDGLFDAQMKLFLKGDLDVIFRVTSARNPMMLDLLKNPGVELFSLKNSLAYEKNMNYLKAFTIPADSLDLVNNLPAKDVNVVATTTSLVVRKDMNPSLQLVMLLVAKQITSESQDLFFAKRDEFPDYVDTIIPISPVAKKYYDFGPPAIGRYFSYGVAAILDGLWPIVLILFVVVYPITKISLRFRGLRTSVEEYPIYDRLLAIEHSLAKGELSPDQKKSFQIEINQFKNNLAQQKVHTGYELGHFELLQAIYAVERRITEN